MSKAGKNPKIRPLQDRILVQRLEGEEKTAGGIIIPDAAKEKPQEGKVVAVGNGKLLDNGTIAKPDVKVGDHILFSRYAGSEIKVAGQEYLLIEEDKIMGVIEA